MLGRRLVTSLLLGVVASAAMSVVAHQQPSPGVTPGIVPLALEALPGSAQPRLAVSPGGQVIASWLEIAGDAGATRLRVASLDRRHRAWSSPRTVAEGRDWFVNWADVPSVVPLTDTLWSAHWLVRSHAAHRYAYDVRMALSRDAGHTWSPAFSPHDDGTPTEHGFVSITPWPGDNSSAAVLWLDGRGMQVGAHGPGDHGNMALRSARVMGDQRVTNAHVIDDRVCECCPTSAVRVGETLLVAYRNRSDAEIRDIHVARLVDGRWEPGRAVAADGWHITACPVNGPALAAQGKDVVLAWFTAAGDRPRVRVALSADAGGTWRPAVDVGGASPLGRVGAAMLGDGSAAVSWIEAEGQGATIRLRRVTADGPGVNSLVVARVGQSRVSGYPRVAVTDDDVIVAWVDTTSEGTMVRTATLHARLLR
jgi:hypothetical protein